MKNDKKLIDRIGPWSTVALTLVYVCLISLFFDHVVNREVDLELQVIATFLALYYTWWQLKLVVTKLTNIIKIKEEK